MLARLRSLFAAAICCATYTAHAHHSFGTFDLDRSIEIVGTIAGIDFVNPHAWLRVNARAADGSTAVYRCEMRGATVLRRSGWRPEMFVVGEPVTVQGAPDRFDPLACYVNTLVLADGRTLDRYSQRTVAAAASPAANAAEQPILPRMANGVPNLSGDWAVEQQLMTDPRGRLGTLVPASSAAQFEPGGLPQGGLALPGSEGSGGLSIIGAFYRLSVGAASPFVVPWLDKPVHFTELGAAAFMPPEQHPQMHCQPTSILLDWYIETLVNRITQTDTAVTIENGRQNGIVRTIHLGGTHPANVEPSRAGHSVGSWEGDVLVVDTVGFLPGMLGLEVAHGSELHVVERFRLNDEGTVLTRDYVATDPDYFIGNYSGTDVTPRSTVPFIVDTCDAVLNPFLGLPLQ
jgi:Family of unknown function (DUF6152)